MAMMGLAAPKVFLSILVLSLSFTPVSGAQAKAAGLERSEGRIGGGGQARQALAEITAERGPLGFDIPVVHGHDPPSAPQLVGRLRGSSHKI